MSCLDFETTNPMNILEIDGASNNSVDNIRELVSNVQYLPTSGKYKIYIIDEVHMLSVSAFNALLKTLEEPPEHVIFMFATTAPEKLLGTVLSRCQRFDFRSATVADLRDHISNISKSEEITFGDIKIIDQLALQGRGSVRDTLSLLDQVLSFTIDKHISEEVMVQALGLARMSAIKRMGTAILVGDKQEVSKMYHTMVHENVLLTNMLSALSDFFFRLIENIDNLDKLIDRDLADDEFINSITASELFWIFETLSKDTSWIFDALNTEVIAEVILQKLSLRRQMIDERLGETSQIEKKTKNKEEEPVVESKELVAESIELKEERVVAKEEVVVIQEEKIKEKEISLPKNWDGFLGFLRGKSPASASNLEQGNITSPVIVENDELIIDLAFGQSAQVFKEYLEDKEVKTRLINNLSEFFEISLEKVSLNLNLLDDVSKKEINFRSKVELSQEVEKKTEDKKREDLLSNPIIVEAQKIFNTNIDKVILDKKE